MVPSGSVTVNEIMSLGQIGVPDFNLENENFDFQCSISVAQTNALLEFRVGLFYGTERQ